MLNQNKQQDRDLSKKEKVAFQTTHNSTHPMSSADYGSGAPAFLFQVPLDYCGLLVLLMSNGHYGFQHLS